MGDATHDRKIAPTAHYTAYVWHRLGFEHAELFVTPLGRAMFWSFRFAGEGLLTWAPFAPSMTQYLTYRHRAYETLVERERPDVVVELGAGLSRRGVTWAARGTRYVEIDLPHMVRAKQRMLLRADRALREAIAGRLEHVSLDLFDASFEDELSRLIGDAERPVVITEGVLTYFTQPLRDQLARAVHAALDGRGLFAGELRVRQPPGPGASALKALRGGIRLVTGGRGAGDDPESHDAVRRSFLDAGFASVEPVDPASLPGVADTHYPARVWVCRPD